MTKALLTSNDIKKFILTELHKIKYQPKTFVTLTALERQLKIAHATIQAYKNLIPHEYMRGKRKYYDIRKATDYLINQGFNISIDF